MTATTKKATQKNYQIFSVSGEILGGFKATAEQAQERFAWYKKAYDFKNPAMQQVKSLKFPGTQVGVKGSRKHSK